MLKTFKCKIKALKNYLKALKAKVLKKKKKSIKAPYSYSKVK